MTDLVPEEIAAAAAATPLPAEPEAGSQAAYPRGTWLDDDLFSLGRINRGKRTDVYAVWSHHRWCLLILKELRAEFNEEPRHAADLMKEGELMRELSHPNLVQLYEARPGPPARLLMEPAAGPNLLTRVDRQGPLSSSAAVQLFLHIGSALLFLHRMGYLHMDVKPANIVCVPGFPKLIDVGIAHRIDRVGKRPKRGGTLGFVPPEQTRPYLAAQGRFCDVFGAAASLHFALTGSSPFPGHREFDAVDLPQLRGLSASPRSLRPRISARLEALLYRALSPVPADRHQSMEEFLHDLSGCAPRRFQTWPADVTLPPAQV